MRLPVGKVRRGPCGWRLTSHGATLPVFRIRKGCCDWAPPVHATSTRDRTEGGAERARPWGRVGRVEDAKHPPVAIVAVVAPPAHAALALP